MRPQIEKPQPVPGIKWIIAIASGKGGVGKSTIAVNLAVALRQLNVRVGLLDADIYGPSQQVMLGIDPQTRPQTKPPQNILPIEAHGLQTMSMGYLVTKKTPMVWRGPMVSSALQQLFSQTLWNNLDCLFIDLPPGTGDIQLTMAQKIPVSGTVIVTTPQDIALLDAKKGIEMFRKTQVKVLGLIENMGYYNCAHCGHEAMIFGKEGGKAIAADYQVPFLASLPLDIHVRQCGDAGTPIVLAHPESTSSILFRQVARALLDMLEESKTKVSDQIPSVQVFQPRQ